MKIESRIGTIASAGTERSLTTNEKKEKILLIIYNNNKVWRSGAKSLAGGVIKNHGRPSCQRKPRILTLCNWVLLCERAACMRSFAIYYSRSSCNETFIYVFYKNVPRLRPMFSDSDAIHTRYDWLDGFFLFLLLLLLSSYQDARTLFFLSVRLGFFHPRSFSRRDCNGWRNPSCYRGNIYTRLFEVSEK